LSKTVTVTLPIALGMAYWKHGRIEKRELAWLAPALPPARQSPRSHAASRRLKSAPTRRLALSLAERAALPAGSVWFYLGKLAWPRT